METVIQPKFLYNKIWRTGRICRNCGLWEYSKENLEEFENWLKEPKCYMGDGDGHLWSNPYKHDIEYRKEFQKEFGVEDE